MFYTTAKGKSGWEGISSKISLSYYIVGNHYIMPSVTQKKKGRPKKEVVIEEGGSESEAEEPPPKRKKRAAKPKAADIGEESDQEEEEEATPTAPPPARKKKVAVAVGDGKKPHISQKRPANKKGQAKDKMAASESVPAVVYYPKKLGYANGDGTTSSSDESKVSSEEEEEWTPAGQKVRWYLEE